MTPTPSAAPAEPSEFALRLTEYGLAMRHGQGEKARVLAEVLESMVAQPSPTMADAIAAGEPTDKDLRAAFTLDTGGPNPYYRCNQCGELEPGIDEYLIKHWKTHSLLTDEFWTPERCAEFPKEASGVIARTYAAYRRLASSAGTPHGARDPAEECPYCHDCHPECLHCNGTGKEQP